MNEPKCDLCAKGFPLKNGLIHYGTQANGMIPDTLCYDGANRAVSYTHARNMEMAGRKTGAYAAKLQVIDEILDGMDYDDRQMAIASILDNHPMR